MRPYISKSIDDLETLFKEASGDTSKLALLLAETANRKTPRAKKLHDTVLQALQGLPAKRSSQKETGTGSAKRNGLHAVDSRPRKRTPLPARSGRGGKKSDLRPTDEQQDCLKKFSSEDSLKVNAFAGAGKTSTLRLLAESTRRKGIYLAFNRSAKVEAREKFPSNVQCATTHGLAFSAMRGRYGGNKLTHSANSIELAEAMSFRDIKAGPARMIRARSLAFLVKETLRRFMYSSLTAPEQASPPRVHGFALLPDVAWFVVERFVREHAKRAWERMCDANDPLPLGHDGYLKLWALGKPKMDVDYILLDEAQDTNPAVLDVIQDQMARAQVIFVGDKHQQIYEWRGAINAMESIQTRSESTLTTSFRFGPEIASAATAVLRNLGEKRAIIGNPKHRSTIGKANADAVLARTNSEVISELIDALESGKAPHLVGGTDDLRALIIGVQDLKAGEPTTAPDLVGFANWSEVIEAVKSGEAEHLKSLVTLVESHSEKQLLWALGRAVDEEKANMVISTAHKAKGLEWRNIRLAQDFDRLAAAGASGKNKVTEAEIRLFYVAMTRAKKNLDVDPATLAFFTREQQRDKDNPQQRFSF